ncbi:MAG: hypothetical protein ACI8W8_000560 [Rhodothermales bacterium]
MHSKRNTHLLPISGVTLARKLGSGEAMQNLAIAQYRDLAPPSNSGVRSYVLLGRVACLLAAGWALFDLAHSFPIKDTEFNTQTAAASSDPAGTTDQQQALWANPAFPRVMRNNLREMELYSAALRETQRFYAAELRHSCVSALIILVMAVVGFCAVGQLPSEQAGDLGPF